MSFISNKVCLFSAFFFFRYSHIYIYILNTICLALWNTSFTNYITKCVNNTTLRKYKVWSKPSVSEQRCVNMRLEVALRFCPRGHIYTYFNCNLVFGIVIWLGLRTRRITSPKMENVETSFNIDVIRPVNLPFIEGEMSLWWLRDETARRH